MRPFLLAVVMVAALGSITRTARADQPRKENTATLIVLGTVAGGVVVMAAIDHPAGLIGGGAIMGLGPSVAYVYAGDVETGLGSALFRSIGAAALVWGAARMRSPCLLCNADDVPDDDPAPNDDDSGMPALAIVGGGLALGGTLIFDLITTRSAVRDRNRRLAASPVTMADGRGGTGYGFAVTGRF